MRCRMGYNWWDIRYHGIQHDVTGYNILGHHGLCVIKHGWGNRRTPTVWFFRRHLDGKNIEQNGGMVFAWLITRGPMRIHWGYNGIIQTFFIMGTIWQYTNNLIWVCQWGFRTFTAGFKGNDYWPCEFGGIFHIIAIPKSVSSELSSFKQWMIQYKHDHSCGPRGWCTMFPICQSHNRAYTVHFVGLRSLLLGIWVGNHGNTRYTSPFSLAT